MLRDSVAGLQLELDGKGQVEVAAEQLQAENVELRDAVVQLRVELEGDAADASIQ